MLEEKFAIQAHLAESNLPNLNLAISASTYVPVSPNQVTIGDKPITYVMVGVVGPAPGTYNARLVLVEKAITKAPVTAGLNRKGDVTYAVSWDARKLPGQPLGSVTDIGTNNRPRHIVYL